MRVAAHVRYRLFLLVPPRCVLGLCRFRFGFVPFQFRFVSLRFVSFRFASFRLAVSPTPWFLPKKKKSLGFVPLLLVAFRFLFCSFLCRFLCYFSELPLRTLDKPNGAGGCWSRPYGSNRPQEGRTFFFLFYFPFDFRDRGNVPGTFKTCPRFSGNDLASRLLVLGSRQL